MILHRDINFNILNMKHPIYLLISQQRLWLKWPRTHKLTQGQALSFLKLYIFHAVRLQWCLPSYPVRLRGDILPRWLSTPGSIHQHMNTLHINTDLNYLCCTIECFQNRFLRFHYPSLTSLFYSCYITKPLHLRNRIILWGTFKHVFKSTTYVEDILDNFHCNWHFIVEKGPPSSVPSPEPLRSRFLSCSHLTVRWLINSIPPTSTFHRP